MNREIKFRGLRKDGKGWVYGCYWWDNVYRKHKIIVALSDDIFDCYEVIPETVGQFTGLKDKNGVDIYEGDKVSFGQFFTTAYVVYYKDDQFRCISAESDEYGPFTHRLAPINDNARYQSKVIGNIHEKEVPSE